MSRTAARVGLGVAVAFGAACTFAAGMTLVASAHRLLAFRIWPSEIARFVLTFPLPVIDATLWFILPLGGLAGLVWPLAVRGGDRRQVVRRGLALGLVVAALASAAYYVDQTAGQFADPLASEPAGGEEASAGWPAATRLEAVLVPTTLWGLSCGVWFAGWASLASPGKTGHSILGAEPAPTDT